MSIRSIVFDIGGVLEITPSTGWVERWEMRLHLPPGGLEERLGEVWRAGSLGTISEAQVERRTGAILDLDQLQVAEFMADLWDEYLGKPNVELIAYFASLRPHYQTALLSNSFVGARHKEQALYRFGDLCDLIVYSHEEGVEKPDRRIYELTCARLGVRPDEVLFLDNYEPYVAAAHALGMRAILFQNTAQAIADIQTCLGESLSSANGPPHES
jgi:putative hydrolase of the HAD superfamily